MQFGIIKLPKKCLLVRFNITLGLLVFVVGVIATIFSTYDNLTDRQAAESLLNIIAVGVLVYAAVFWIVKALGLPCPVCKSS